MTTRDVVIVGGGIIGLAIAHELAHEGLRVTVLERGTIGGMAMYAFAGILGMSGGTGPLNDLAGLSARRYQTLGSELREATGVDIERVAVPSLHVARTADDAAELRRALPAMRVIAPDAVWLDPPALHVAEPRLAPHLAGALAYSGESHIRPRATVTAFAEAAVRRGAEIRESAEVVAIETHGGRVTGVRLPDGGLPTDLAILATGVWSGIWGERLGLPLPVTPLRGQLVRLGRRGPTLRHIVYDGGAYVVEKVGGVIAVGATEEDAGFDRRVTASGVAGLTSLVADLLPSLGDATFLDAWAGLRPVAADLVPLIGWAPGIAGLFVAAGHARNGIFLAPATAAVAAAMVAGRTPPVDARPFSPARFVSDAIGGVG